MTFRIAHISDLHIVSNSANLKTAFWDFVLLAGPPVAVMPFLKPYLEDPEKRENLWKKLLYHSDEEKIDYRKIAAITALGIPAAFFLGRQLLRLKQILYLRKDTARAREVLLSDLAEQKVDHVVITGDITNVASKAELQIAEVYVRKLRSICGVTLVPGNHDVNIQRMAALGENGKLDRYLEYFGDGRRRYQFPFMRTIGDLCLIALDSTCFNPFLNSRGAISEGQIDRLNDALQRSEVRDVFKVLLIHHHVKPAPRRNKLTERFLALSNVDELLSLAKDNNVGLILHGHEHRMYEYDVGRIKLHCAGATTEVNSGIKENAAYKIYEFNNGTIQARTKTIAKQKRRF